MHQLGHRDLKEVDSPFQTVSYMKQEALALWKKKFCIGSMEWTFNISATSFPAGPPKLVVHQFDIPSASTPEDLGFESSSFTFRPSWYGKHWQEKFDVSVERLLSRAGASVPPGGRHQERQRWSHRMHSPSTYTNAAQQEHKEAEQSTIQKKGIFKGRIFMETPTLKLKAHSSTAGSLQQHLCLTFAAPSASKDLEKPCYKECSHCTGNSSHLLPVLWCQGTDPPELDIWEEDSGADCLNT